MIKKYIEKDLKLTPQRLAILDYLDGNKDHPSAEDIYNAVSKKFPTMSFATVYNTLERLKLMGEVIELTINAEKKHFDPNTKHHHHLMCIECKKIVDIFTDFKLEMPVIDKKGFEIIGNHIGFYGVCPRCKTKTLRR
ncbi:MAG: transcriptional repressor [Nitrospirae bacterium]|nr:transcriptional repressor [Nitrospirota bacterium]